MLAAAKDGSPEKNMSKYRAGAGPGHDQFPRHRVRPSRFPHRHGPEGVPADLSPARLGRARCGGDLVDAARVRAVRAQAGRRERVRHHGDRRDQPARDRRAVGPRDRGSDRQRHRLAGPAHRGAMRRTACDGRGGTGPGENRPRARSVLLRNEAGLAARSRARRARARRARRTRVRDGRQLADLEPDRRGGTRHRRQQRLAHVAVQPARHCSGTTNCSNCSAFRAACCRGLRRRARSSA